jgi:CheY-like chemotaxis protein
MSSHDDDSSSSDPTAPRPRDADRRSSAGDSGRMQPAQTTPAEPCPAASRREDGNAGDFAAALTPESILRLLGQGVAVVEPSGEISWMTASLASQPPETMRRFADACAEAIAAWTREPTTASTVRAEFRVGRVWHEVVASPLRRDASGARPDGAVAILTDASATHRVQDRLDAIDQAGAQLLHFDADMIRSMNASERLGHLEGRVVSATRSVLGFDHFEYRLTNRRTGQLELVFCSGLVPLGIGERLFARAEGNGISGLVAATGRSVVCQDSASDQRYVAGLPGARSSLTVPLLLHDRTVGVLNVESTAPRAFDDEDRIAAELMGRYVALSLNILDMLVAERCETNRVLLANVAREAQKPLAQMAEDARALLPLVADPDGTGRVRRLVENAARIDALLRETQEAPTGVLGCDEQLREGMRDPVFAGRRIAVADDDPTIRRTVRAVFEQQGAEVDDFDDGVHVIAAIRARASEGRPYELVVSDVRMPDANGYEVFSAAKESAADTPVILMTAFGYDPNHSVVRSNQEGLHACLYKPFQISRLLEEAKRALGAGESGPTA